MMVDLYQNYKRPLTHQILFDWHEMLTSGRRDLKNIGSYRIHSDPMVVVSGALHKPKIHYQALPSEIVKGEMDKFINWFNETRDKPLALVRSGIAHLYFESIHPFEDGNGRIGRAISEKSLSQSLGRPTLIAISHTIESRRNDYYAALKRNSIGIDINNWLEYFCKMVLQAQGHTQSMIDFIIEKGKFYHQFGESLNNRQGKVLRRIFREGIGGFKGGLSASNYIRIAGTTSSTATRDLQHLVEQGAMVRTGQRKGTRYYLNLAHQDVKI